MSEDTTPGAIVGARAIDQALSRWVRLRSGSALVARAAYAVSVAEGQGDACAALDEDASFSSEDVDALRAHAWVRDGSVFHRLCWTPMHICIPGAAGATRRVWLNPCWHSRHVERCL